MIKRICVLIAAVLSLGPAEPVCGNATLWYNGDFSGGLSVNEHSTGSYGISADSYAEFSVIDPGGWTLGQIWSNDMLRVGPAGITQAAWAIRSGISPGNGGTLIASGTDSVTLTPTGRSDSLGQTQYTEYTVEVPGLSIFLTPGSYWLSVSPLVGVHIGTGGKFDSYISVTQGANSIGATGNYMDGFNNGVSGYFVHQGRDYSMGVAGVIGAVPEPSPIHFLGIGALVLCGYAWKGQPGFGCTAGEKRSDRREKTQP